MQIFRMMLRRGNCKLVRITVRGSGSNAASARRGGEADFDDERRGMHRQEMRRGKASMPASRADKADAGDRTSPCPEEGIVRCQQGLQDVTIATTCRHGPSVNNPDQNGRLKANAMRTALRGGTSPAVQSTRYPPVTSPAVDQLMK